MKKSLLTASILAAGLAFSGVAQAVVAASSTLNVSATVAVDCTVTTTPVNFGILTANLYTLANGDVSVTCTTGTPYTITLDAGLNGVDGIWRHMKHSTDGVSLALYHLLTGSGGEWGDAGYANTLPGANGVADTSNGLAQSHTVYGGALGVGPFTPAGAYSDTVTVTVNY